MFPNSINYSFRHSTIALLTKHHKEREIAPLVQNYLGAAVEVIAGYDTDELGTFTREKKREQSQIDTARIKARKAIELSGYKIGIGSEGSFGTDPYTGMMPWSTEMVVLIDIENEIEIVGAEQRQFRCVQKKIRTIAELEELLSGFDFPHNNLVLRPNDENSPIIRKDFRDKNDLYAVFKELGKNSDEGVIFVENDHRAHRSADRMEAIRYATIDLLMKCHSYCPKCNSPGFWVHRGEGGLPCNGCGAISDTFQYLVYRCSKCSYEQRILRTDIQSVDPRYCNICNP